MIKVAISRRDADEVFINESATAEQVKLYWDQIKTLPKDKYKMIVNEKDLTTIYGNYEGHGLDFIRDDISNLVTFTYFKVKREV